MWDLIISVPDHCLSFYFWSLNGLMPKRRTGGAPDLLLIILTVVSRRLIGEFIAQAGIRCPLTFSNDIFSEALMPILAKFHI